MDPIVLAKAGPFELLATCAYGKYDNYRETCQEIAVINVRGVYLCQACYDILRAAEKKYDEDLETYYRK
jgi:hypothetical protein